MQDDDFLYIGKSVKLPTVSPHIAALLCIWWESLESTFNEFPVFSAALLTMVITLYIRYVDVGAFLRSTFVRSLLHMVMAGVNSY